MKIPSLSKVARRVKPIINNAANFPTIQDYPMFIKKAPVFQQPSAFSLKVRDIITYFMEHCGFVNIR